MIEKSYKKKKDEIWERFLRENQKDLINSRFSKTGDKKDVTFIQEWFTKMNLEEELKMFT